jgi:hypothetical protein
LGLRCKLQFKVSDPCREQGLEGEVTGQNSRVFGELAAEANAKKASGAERLRRLCKGQRPWRGNPKSVTGMKQGRKVSGDASRQEGEKP